MGVSQGFVGGTNHERLAREDDFVQTHMKTVNF